MREGESWAAVVGCILWSLTLLIPSAAAAEAGVPASIALEQRGYGWMLRDADGLSLYVTDRDQDPAKSTCVDDCAEKWPPLLAGDGVSAGDDWRIIEREDGSRQWAFRNKPLHRYEGDEAPGHTFGDGQENVWHLAVKMIETPARIGIRETQLGHVLVDASTGRTLYMHDEETAEKSACDRACARIRVPIKAPLLASGWNEWGIVTRTDGMRQWAYRDKPLYGFAGDWNPGETMGHQESGPWRAAILEPRPAVPDWVTVQGSDAGPILADQEGRTLYGRGAPRGFPPPPEVQALRKEMQERCGVECPGSPWRPVMASADAQPVADWSVVDREDGTRQWAFNGEPLYTNVWDERPGQLHGVRSGDRSWHALMLSGERMQGTGN